MSMRCERNRVSGLISKIWRWDFSICSKRMEKRASHTLGGNPLHCKYSGKMQTRGGCRRELRNGLVYGFC